MSQSLVVDFEGIMIERVYPAIANAMPKIGEELEKAIDNYSSDFDGPRTRPLLFGHGKYEMNCGADFVTITNITPMQGKNYGIPEVVFVEEGLESYHMPYPRPFMEPARDDFVASGKPDAIIQIELGLAGLT